MTTENSASRERYWLCPLYSFNCDCQSVDLAEGIQIRPAPSQLGQYIQKRTYYLYGQWDDPSNISWVALFPYLAEAIEGAGIENIKIGLEENDRAGDLLFDLVTSLRLYQRGEITVGPLIFGTIHNSQWSIEGDHTWTVVSQRDFLHKELKYVLQQTDVPQVNELLNNLIQLRKLRKLDSVGIALRRFHSSYHGDIEDRIIDQMIAFESLYLTGLQELTYKLALRVAFLLGRENRSGIFSDMKQAYNYRSRIVHGENIPSRDKLRAVGAKTEEYLRQSIRRVLLLLSQGHSLKQIREKLLDENILKNGE